MRWGGRKVARLRAAVIATHGSTCVLCHQPIDLTLAWPDPMSFSIEHLDSRSHGGSDWLANLRPSHLTCNSGRGNRPALPAGRRPAQRGRFSTG